MFALARAKKAALKLLNQFFNTSLRQPEACHEILHSRPGFQGVDLGFYDAPCLATFLPPPPSLAYFSWMSVAGFREKLLNGRALVTGFHRAHTAMAGCKYRNDIILTPFYIIAMSTEINRKPHVSSHAAMGKV